MPVEISCHRCSKGPLQFDEIRAIEGVDQWPNTYAWSASNLPCIDLPASQSGRLFNPSLVILCLDCFDLAQQGARTYHENYRRAQEEAAKAAATWWRDFLGEGASKSKGGVRAVRTMEFEENLKAHRAVEVGETKAVQPVMRIAQSGSVQPTGVPTAQDPVPMNAFWFRTDPLPEPLEQAVEAERMPELRWNYQTNRVGVPGRIPIDERSIPVSPVIARLLWCHQGHRWTLRPTFNFGMSGPLEVVYRHPGFYYLNRQRDFLIQLPSISLFRLQARRNALNGELDRVVTWNPIAGLREIPRIPEARWEDDFVFDYRIASLFPLRNSQVNIDGFQLRVQMGITPEARVSLFIRGPGRDATFVEATSSRLVDMQYQWQLAVERMAFNESFQS